MRRVWLTAMISLLAVPACRSLVRRPDAATLPVQHSIVRDQLVMYSDFPLPKQHRLLDELAAQRGDVADRLGLPLSAEPIHVYLFRSPETFQTFIATHHPDFPQRRAFFVETDARLSVYAYWGDRMAEDLRHEVAHGYLHASVRYLPLWLDEGLAEYFEVPRGFRGRNFSHMAELTDRVSRGDWRPDIRHLERIASAAEMTQLDYAESWAWVYFLLETTSERKDLLRGYLQHLRQEGTAPPLSLALRTLHVEPNQTLLEYVGTWPAAGDE